MTVTGLRRLLSRKVSIEAMLEFAMWIYIAWYLYRGMRNVYQQRRAITVAKYFAVGFFYLGAASTVLVLTALFSAMIA